MRKFAFSEVNLALFILIIFQPHLTLVPACPLPVEQPVYKLCW